MTKITRKITDPTAKAENAARRHDLHDADAHEVSAWVDANIRTMADVRKLLVWLVIIVLAPRRVDWRKKNKEIGSK